MDIQNLLERLPLDATKKVIKFYEELSDELKVQFTERIGCYQSIQQLQENYHSEMEDQFSRDIFIIQPKGLGMGEVWIAWLVKDAVISGGGESFDVLSNGVKYEAKAYNFFPHYKTKVLQLGKYEGVWRLGNAGAMSNFTFMQHLIHVVDVCHELLINDIELYGDLKKAVTIIKRIEKQSKKYGMIGDFARGEISKKKMRMIIDVIDLLHKHVSKNQTDYNLVTFASPSPGNPNITYLIEPTTEDNIANGNYKMVGRIDLSDIKNPISLNRMLIKSKYIRNGVQAMINDINNDLNKVESKYEGVNFIIFRKSGMYISNQLKKIKGNTKQDLKDAVGTVFNVSSASVRVRENC